MIRKVFLIVCVSLVFTWALLQFALLSSLKNKFYDALFYFRGPVQDKGEAVVIVSIDEVSLEKIGNWPWPRSMLASLIEKIKLGGPKVIGVDLLLDLPTRGKNAQKQDSELAEVFKGAPVCVLPVAVKEERSGRFQETLFKPLDIFLSGSAVTGVVNVESDPADKMTREFKVMYGTMPSFPVAVCREYSGCSLKDLGIPAHNTRALINYKCAKVDNFSASDVLEPFFDPGIFFQGKIVLIGRTDMASKDFVNTPVPAGKIFETQSMTGIELWKEIIDMILARNFLYGLPPFLVFLIAAFLSIIICSLTLRSNKIGAVSSVVCVGICVFSFIYLFLKKNIVLPVLFLAAVCVLSYIFSFLYNFIVFQREKRRISAAFKSYISPHVLQGILMQKIDLSVSAKRKILTMLFADIKGFTGFSDTHGPEEVLAFLKAFFSQMNQAITESNGIINKLMGDGILAFFGDFTDSGTHAYDAVRAAIEMQMRVPALQKCLGFDFQIRIGVHTGPVDVGNIGSREHLDYTVIGRNVNLAQRLEANCEPGEVLISDDTYQIVKDKVEISDTREIPLKGFVNPVRVCTVIGLK
ncbi:MAG: adenylate/guanylate cyclase domain-containing protein [Candidatus Omnitrophota bacterium]